MSENNSLFSKETLPTIVAVTMVLALLGLVLNYYNYSRTDHAVAGNLTITKTTTDRLNAISAETKSASAKFEEMEGRINKLETMLQEHQAEAAAAAPPE